MTMLIKTKTQTICHLAGYSRLHGYKRLHGYSRLHFKCLLYMYLGVCNYVTSYIPYTYMRVIHLHRSIWEIFGNNRLQIINTDKKRNYVFFSRLQIGYTFLAAFLMFGVSAGKESYRYPYTKTELQQWTVVEVLRKYNVNRGDCKGEHYQCDLGTLAAMIKERKQ